MQGGTVLDPEVVARLVTRSSKLERLTAREAETLELMAQGHANAAIARALGVTHATVAKHINNILVKLDLQQSADHHRRVVAVLTFLDHRNNET